MADSSAWQQIPELDILAQIAAHDGITFRIRGSLAERLTKFHEEKSPGQEASLYDCVAPFSDIDLIVKDRFEAAQLSTRIKEVVPGARFFHWEIHTEETLARYRGLSSVVLTGQPEILFRKKQGSPATENLGNATSTVEYCPTSGELRITHLPRPTVQVKLHLDRAINLRQTLIDLLYMARRFPGMLEEARDLVAHIHERASAMRSLGQREARRLLFPLLKFLFYNSERKRMGSWIDLNHLLGGEVLQGLKNMNKDPLWTRLIDLCCLGEWRDPIVAVISPKLGAHGAWERRIQDVFLATVYHPSVRGASRLLEKSGAAGFVGLSSPLVLVPTGRPPSPGCCLFRDFARGITEVGWVPPEGYSDEPPTSMAAVFIEDEDPLAVQTRSSIGPISSFRVDYNLLSILNTSPRPLGVAVISQRD